MKFLVVLLLLVVAALCQQKPTISDDFTADAIVIMSVENSTHTVKYEGKIYEDYTSKKSRVDTEHNHERHATFEFLQIFGTNGAEYEIMDNRTCRHRPLTRTMHPAFGWVTDASLAGNPCHSKTSQEVGNHWVLQKDGFQASVCVSKTQANTPLWVDFQAPDDKFSRMVEFKSFTAGRPNADLFNVPSVCKK